MDNRLFLGLFFVTLSWVFVDTNTNPTNATSASPNSTTMVTTVNATATLTISMNTAITSANTTKNGTTGGGTNMTNSTQMTNSGTTGGGTNMTNSTQMTNSGTTGGGTNMTITTGANNISFITAINFTVQPLQTNINRSSCGVTQLCAAQPATCDPSLGGSCFFFAAKQDGTNFDFDLSGMSDGYIAATLSTGILGNNDTTYVCARSGQGVKFFGARLNNNMLTKSPVTANSVQGRVNGNQIQCAFVAPVTSQTRASTNSLAVSTGTYNDTSGELGNATAVIKATGVDLTNPNTNVTNDVNATTAPTSAPTVAGNSTGSNATTVAGNSTGSNATTSAPNITIVSTSAATTAIPVAALQTPISRTNCGTSKLCAAQPSTCDPATGTGCYFISAQQQSGQLYNFEVSGDSDGYIAAGVSTSTNVTGPQQAYICANSNGVVKFFTANITNLTVNLTQSNANNVKGAINSRKIQCTFAATLLDTTVREAGYSLSVSNGTYNSSTGTFGQARFQLLTNVVNLSDPTANATNQISGAYSATYQQPLIPALLVSVVMLTFSAL